MIKKVKELTENYMRENDLSPREFAELSKISETSIHNLLYSKRVGIKVIGKVIDTIGYELILKEKNINIEDEKEEEMKIDIEVVNSNFLKINGKIMIKSYFDGKWREESVSLTEKEREFLKGFVKLNKL